MGRYVVVQVRESTVIESTGAGEGEGVLVLDESQDDELLFVIMWIMPTIIGGGGGGRSRVQSTMLIFSLVLGNSRMILRSCSFGVSVGCWRDVLNGVNDNRRCKFLEVVF